MSSIPAATHPDPLTQLAATIEALEGLASDLAIPASRQAKLAIQIEALHGLFAVMSAASPVYSRHPDVAATIEALEGVGSRRYV